MKSSGYHEAPKSAKGRLSHPEASPCPQSLGVHRLRPTPRPWLRRAAISGVGDDGKIVDRHRGFVALERGDYAGSLRRPARRKPRAPLGKPAHCDNVFDPDPDRVLGRHARERLVDRFGLCDCGEIFRPLAFAPLVL